MMRPAELDPDGPHACAVAWLGALQTGDGQAAWDLLHVDLQIALLAEGVPGESDDRTAQRALQAMQDEIGRLSLTGWGVATDPRPEGVDLERVIVVPPVDTSRGDVVTPALSFLMQLTADGWRVAAVALPAGNTLLTTDARC